MRESFLNIADSFVKKEFYDGEYQGELKSMIREGRGSMRYYSGSNFIGRWKNDVWEYGFL